VEVHAVPTTDGVPHTPLVHVVVVQMQLLQTVLVLLEPEVVLVPVLVAVLMVQAPATAQVHPVEAQVQVLVELAQLHGTLAMEQLLLRLLASKRRFFRLKNQIYRENRFEIVS
jgi:hypothetical protein